MKHLAKYVLVCCFIFSVSAQAKLTVGVFCATNDTVPDSYKNEAFALGALLAQSGYDLITGGGNSGLMNAVMNGFGSEDASPFMHAAIPSVFKEYDVHHLKIPENNLYWTDTIYERLNIFHEKCDVMVILPGGFGTLHELLDFLVPKQWGLTDKKIILFNYEEFWNPLLMQFELMVEKNTLKRKHLELFKVTDTAKNCIEVIEQEGNLLHKGLQERYWETP